MNKDAKAHEQAVQQALKDANSIEEAARALVDSGLATSMSAGKRIATMIEARKDPVTEELISALEHARASLANSVRNGEGGMARQTTLDIVEDTLAKAKP